MIGRRARDDNWQGLPYGGLGGEFDPGGESDPVALATLGPGQTVLDLGSGGGIDCFLAAKKVGPEGKVIGLDMTPDMIKLARRNAKNVGATNVEFRYGEMEDIPLPDESVDVIISNCVINLSGDKDAVLREAFRVLKPGGRFAVSDIVTRGGIPSEIRQNFLLWAGCIAGALEEEEYYRKLASAGFEDISIEPTRIYRSEDLLSLLAEKGFDVSNLAREVDEKFISGFIRAVKPRE